MTLANKLFKWHRNEKGSQPTEWLIKGGPSKEDFRASAHPSRKKDAYVYILRHASDEQVQTRCFCGSDKTDRTAIKSN